MLARQNVRSTSSRSRKVAHHPGTMSGASIEVLSGSKVREISPGGLVGVPDRSDIEREPVARSRLMVDVLARQVAGASILRDPELSDERRSAAVSDGTWGSREVVCTMSAMC